MEEIKKLIERFWEGSATPAERQNLYRSLVTIPSQWIEESESIYKIEVSSGTNPLTEAESAEILQKLHQRMRQDLQLASSQDNETTVLSWWNGWRRMTASAAASVLIIAGIFLFSEKRDQPIKVANYETRKQVLRQIVNHENGVMMFTLADLSQVKLYPKSSVSFYEPFDSRARNISLSGKGSFKVAKDKLRPFSVYAGGTVTTALGTQFVITAPAEGSIVVKLLEGQVVVKSDPAGAFRMENIYLQPGQELLVDRRVKQTVIKQYKENVTKTNISAPVVLENVPVSGLSFNRTPLDKVFHQLEAHYKTHIEFDNKVMEGLSFTGALMPSDSLAIALSAVCRTNDLIFRQEADRMIVYKK